MKNNKNIFPFAAAIAAALFLGFYVFLEIPLVISLVCSGLGLVGSTLALKQGKKAPAVITGGISQKDLDEALAAGYDKLTQIKKFNGFAYTTPIKDDLDAIEMTTIKIFEEIKRDPPDLKRANQFLSYYLDAVLRILTNYKELRRHNLNDPEINESLKHVENVFTQLRGAFETQFTRLLNNDVSDLDVELSLLENTLKMEGLCK